jgi:RNA polymerase sigma-70 factor (ECF subfamily)
VVPLDGPADGPAPAIVTGIPALDDETERQLLARAGVDPDAFAALYRAHLDAVHRFLLRRSRCPQVAEDVTSTTFERALRGVDGFRWRPGGFRAWLYRIAANELAGYQRDRLRVTTPHAQRTLVRYVERPSDGDLDDIDRLLETAAARDRLVAALDALSPAHQEVLALRYLAGLEVAEAAEALGCSRGALAVRAHRALAALRVELQRHSPVPEDLA